MAGYGRQVGQAVGMVDGQLRGAGATGPVRPSLGRGGSPKLEKMSTVEGERKRAAAAGARVHRTRGEAVGRRCFFSFFGSQNNFFLKLECAAGN
jgi:hypothetical protein